VLVFLALSLNDSHPAVLKSKQGALMKKKKKTFRYADGTTPPKYKCKNCGATGCKLWLEYSVIFYGLLCATCAAKEEGKNIDDIDDDGQYSSKDYGGSTNQIGWYVPAIPTEDRRTYWAFTSAPEEGWKWWQKLPTLPSGKN
jgi:hypothetical protein